LTRLRVLVVIGLPEHYWNSMCTLADGPPGSFDLVERGPERRRQAHRREQPDIDAAVCALAEEVAGQPHRAVPGLLPGDGALDQECEDPVGNDFVGVRTCCCLHGKPT